MLRNFFPFIPSDPRKCKPSKIFKLKEGQVWCDEHAKIGKCMIQIYRGLQGCKCKVYSNPYKDNARFPCFMLCPVKLDKEHYATAKEIIPVN